MSTGNHLPEINTMKQTKTKHSFALCIVLHQPNLATVDQDTTLVHEAWNSVLFPAITETYIPLLRMFDSLAKNNIPYKVNMVITPTLCSLLDDYIVQEHYTLWLENLLDLGEKEIQNTKDNPELHALAQSYMKNLRQTYSYFAGITQGTLLLKFLEHAKEGRIEFLATTAEHCYLPHYIHASELIDAQIEAGLIAHKKFFKSVPEGFWLPLMGYAPGIEENIQKYGFDYTVLNTHGFLFADPLPAKGIFNPLRCKNSLAVFAHDKMGWETVFGTNGLSQNPVYRNQNRDIGFEATIDDLQMFLKKDQARYATGFKYWSKTTPHELYNIDNAIAQAKLDAKNYVDSVSNRLIEASKELNGEKTSLLCVLNEQDIGQNWFEGISWLSEVITTVHKSETIQQTSLSELSENKQDFEKATFFMSSSEGNGYGENLLDNTNSWIYHYSIKAVERMIELAKRFPDDTGLKERSLNLAARQILFASASDWAKMVQVPTRNEQELELFVQSILDFSTIFDSLGASSISTEWLTQAEKRYPFFQWLNYRVFCKKV